MNILQKQNSKHSLFPDNMSASAITALALLYSNLPKDEIYLALIELSPLSDNMQYIANSQFLGLFPKSPNQSPNPTTNPFYHPITKLPCSPSWCAFSLTVMSKKPKLLNCRCIPGSWLGH